MVIQPIKNEVDYNQALQCLDAIFDAPENTPEGDEAESLFRLIERYEDEHCVIEAPDPVEAIKNSLRLNEAETDGFSGHNWRKKSRLGSSQPEA